MNYDKVDMNLTDNKFITDIDFSWLLLLRIIM